MRSRTIVLMLVAVVLIAGLSYAGWKYVDGRASHSCAACQRPTHENTRTVAVTNGKQMGYCCPACALSQHRQTGASVDVLSLTEYQSGAKLEPERSYLVRGSDVNSCSHHSAAVALDKQPVDAHFDRCSPSLLAFGSKGAADRFAREHGGQVLRFADVSAMFH